MKAFLFLSTLAALAALNVDGASRSSSRYSVPADSADSGGRRASSAAYSNDGCVGGVAGVGSVAAPVETAKHGYVGQLYEVRTLALSADPTNVDEGGTRQLVASAILDDSSVMNVAGTRVSWSVLSGPLASIDNSGLASADNVYEDTPATAQGTWYGQSASIGLLVRNVGEDDFGQYAKDGIDDAWQVQYFGLNNPEAGPDGDPDGDRQTTGYEYVVGSNPMDGNSFFQFHVELVPGRPAQKNLIFSPRVAGRTYTVQYKLDLAAPGFADLGGISTTDIGPTRTVTDLNATEPNKFYRVQVTLP